MRSAHRTPRRDEDEDEDDGDGEGEGLTALRVERAVVRSELVEERKVEGVLGGASV